MKPWYAVQRASVAFVFYSLAQGPVTPLMLSVRGIEPAPHGLSARHCNHSATGASSSASRLRAKTAVPKTAVTSVSQSQSLIKPKPDLP